LKSLQNNQMCLKFIKSLSQICLKFCPLCFQEFPKVTTYYTSQLFLLCLPYAPKLTTFYYYSNTYTIKAFYYKVIKKTDPSTMFQVFEYIIYRCLNSPLTILLDSIKNQAPCFKVSIYYASIMPA